MHAFGDLAAQEVGRRDLLRPGGYSRLPKYLENLEARLAGREFVAAGRFSVADVTAAVAVDFARVVKVKPDPERHPNVVRWRAALGTRPSMSL